jgi:hypothetical protein
MLGAAGCKELAGLCLLIRGTVGWPFGSTEFVIVFKTEPNAIAVGSQLSAINIVSADNYPRRLV